MSAKPGNAERDPVAIARRPWDRQPKESPKAFEAFATYRDMAYQRSLAAVGWKLHKSKTLLERWSAAHGWVERVRDGTRTTTALQRTSRWDTPRWLCANSAAPVNRRTWGAI